MTLLRLIPVGQAYASEDRAKAAADALLAKGFDEYNISMFTPSMIEAEKPGVLAKGSHDGVDSTRLLAQLVMDVHEASRVPPAHAMVYADNLQTGRSLVLVTAPFGQAQAATDSLGSVEHIDIGTLPVPDHYRWDQAAPLSAWLRLPVLKHGRSWMASSFKELTDPDYLPTKNVAGGLLSDNPTPLSSKLGLRAVGDNNPAPLSSKFGLSVLKENSPTPLSSKFGLDVLKKDSPTPLSSKLGLEVLSKDRPAREKYSFGLPLLLRDNPTPLSSLLGLPLIKRGERRREEPRHDDGAS